MWNERRSFPREPVEQFLLPRTDADHFTIGPWDVPKLQDDQVRADLLEQPGQKGEVIVLNEGDRGIWPHLV
jgi:hypothetical protein